MGDETTVGIVGGYGATGKVVAAELWKSTHWQIRIGGRSLDQANTAAASFDQRVNAAQLDVLNDRSLDAFCRGCSLVINCAGPVSLLHDRVAQSSFRNRCHYIDPAGMSFVRERLSARNAEIASLGLSFVASAGWIPGLSELLPIYAHMQASTHMESIESVTVYFGDSGEWSPTAFRDMVWFLRRRGLRRPLYFRKGEPTRTSLRQSSPQVDLGIPIGLGRFNLISTPELDSIGHRFNTCDFFPYAYMPSLRVALTATLILALPLGETFSMSMLQNAFRSASSPVGGFVVAQARGRSQGRNQLFTAQVAYDKHRDYWIHGTTMATVARMVMSRKGVRPGVNFLTDAIDPMALLAELKNSGIELTEDLHTA